MLSELSQSEHTQPPPPTEETEHPWPLRSLLWVLHGSLPAPFLPKTVQCLPVLTFELYVERIIWHMLSHAWLLMCHTRFVASRLGVAVVDTPWTQLSLDICRVVDFRTRTGVDPQIPSIQ